MYRLPVHLVCRANPGRQWRRTDRSRRRSRSRIFYRIDGECVRYAAERHAFEHQGLAGETEPGGNEREYSEPAAGFGQCAGTTSAPRSRMREWRRLRDRDPAIGGDVKPSEVLATRNAAPAWLSEVRDQAAGGDGYLAERAAASDLRLLDDIFNDGEMPSSSCQSLASRRSCRHFLWFACLLDRRKRPCAPYGPARS